MLPGRADQTPNATATMGLSDVLRAAGFLVSRRCPVPAGRAPDIGELVCPGRDRSGRVKHRSWRWGARRGTGYAGCWRPGDKPSGESVAVETRRTAVSLVLPILALGLLASLSPATIIVFILVLATTRARVNAIAFLVGWGVSLTIVFAVAYVIGGTHATRQSGGRVWVDVIEIILGVALVAGGRRALAAAEHTPTSFGSFEGPRRSPQSVASVGGDGPGGAQGALVDHRRSRRGGSPLSLWVGCRPPGLRAVLGGVDGYGWPGLLVPLQSPRQRLRPRLSAVKDLLVRLGPVVFAAMSLAVGLYLIADGLVTLLG